MKLQGIIKNRKETKIKNLKFNYDSLNDLLYAYKENSSVYSNVIIGEFHLDFNKNNEFVGMEILNASNILKEYGIEDLDKINKIEIKVITNCNSMIIAMEVISANVVKTAMITLNNLESPIVEECF